MEKIRGEVERVSHRGRGRGGQGGEREGREMVG